MANTFEQDLNAIKAVEDKLTSNKVAQFAYTQEAYNDPEHYADGVQSYNVNNPNNIPVADASIMKVNETVLSKGYRSQASSITRMLLNHFLGRVSYNLNKVNDLLSSLVTSIKSNLGRANGIATLDASGRIPFSQLPETALEFKGTWDASTNIPVLKDGTGTKGDFYICTVAGTADFGTAQSPREVRFFENDRVIYDGSLWERLSAGDVKTVNNVQPVDGNIPLTKGDIGLGNVDNTSDADKPVSTAQGTAISQAEARAKDLANASGVLGVAHGGTGAGTTEGARTNLNINNVENTGDSATPLENGTTKFTTGGAYAELMKKSNSYEKITIADLTPYSAYNSVPLIHLLDTIQTNFPRYGRCGIAKFAEEEDYIEITFDEPSNLRLRTSGLLIIGIVGFPHSATSSRPSNDSVVLLVTKDLAVYTCRCTRNGSTGTLRSVAVQSQSSLTFDSAPTAGSSNPVTSDGIKSYVDTAIDGLDAGAVGGAGKYIKAISEANGIITATEETMDTAPTANSTKAITSGAVKTALDNKVDTTTKVNGHALSSDVTVTKSDVELGNVANTGDSATPVSGGTTKFTTGGAFDFFGGNTKASAWLGKVFGWALGRKWAQVMGDTSTESFYSVHHAEGIWVAGTDDGAWWSDDGKSWTQCTDQQSGSAIGETFGNVFFRDSVVSAYRGWIALGNHIWRSTDGKRWTEGQSFVNKPLLCAYYNDRQIFVGTYGGGIWQSNDGRIWGHMGMSGGSNDYTIRSVRYENGTWVAGSDSNGLWWQEGGASWEQVSGVTSTYTFLKVYYANGLWVALSEEHGIWWSNDGKSWTQVTSYSGMSAYTFLTVHYANGLWIAGSSEHGLWYSVDGKVWNPILGVTNTYTFREVYYANGLWVALYDGYGIWWSNDGKSWSQAEDNTDYTTFYALSNADGIWIAGANHQGLWWSDYTNAYLQ